MFHNFLWKRLISDSDPNPDPNMHRISDSDWSGSEDCFYLVKHPLPSLVKPFFPWTLTLTVGSCQGSFFSRITAYKCYCTFHFLFSFIFLLSSFYFLFPVFLIPFAIPMALGLFSYRSKEKDLDFSNMASEPLTLCIFFWQGYPAFFPIFHSRNTLNT